MKLIFWKISELAAHQGFAIHDFVARPGELEVRLEHLEIRDLKVNIIFRNHTGFLSCHEFGMEGLIADSPARRGEGGANFFIAHESEFSALLRRGDVGSGSSLNLTSFVLVDADRWIEVVTAEKPEIEILSSTQGLRH